MRQNATKLSNKRHEKAAQMVADDDLTDDKIAAELGIHKATLERWKATPEFEARVEQITDAYAKRALMHGLAVQEKRISIMNELHAKLLRIIAERAADPTMQAIPGGDTGLVVRTIKGIGKGDDYQVVEVFEVDTMTVKAIREIHNQVADEVGQKVTRSLVEIIDNLAQSARDRLMAKLCPEGGRDASSVVENDAEGVRARVLAKLAGENSTAEEEQP